jgi:hypothetical protein
MHLAVTFSGCFVDNKRESMMRNTIVGVDLIIQGLIAYSLTYILLKQCLIRFVVENIQTIQQQIQLIVINNDRI